jgi:hypothetical protein
MRRVLIALALVAAGCTPRGRTAPPDGARRPIVRTSVADGGVRVAR